MTDIQAVLATIDTDRLTELVREVCRIPSVLGEEGPLAAYLRDLMRESGFEATELGLVDKSAHADLVEVGHFGKQIADLHVISRFGGQRIERAICRSGNAAVADFFFKRSNFAAQLLDLQRRAVGVELYAVHELLLGGGELFDLAVGPGEVQIIGGQLILGGGLLGNKALEGIVIALETVAQRQSGGKLAFGLGRFVRAAAGISGAEIIFGAEKLGARVGKLGSGVLDVQLEQELTFFYGLALHGANPFDEGIELRANHEGGDRLNLSVA